MIELVTPRMIEIFAVVMGMLIGFAVVIQIAEMFYKASKGLIESESKLKLDSPIEFDDTPLWRAHGVPGNPFAALKWKNDDHQVEERAPGKRYVLSQEGELIEISEA